MFCYKYNPFFVRNCSEITQANPISFNDASFKFVNIRFIIYHKFAKVDRMHLFYLYTTEYNKGQKGSSV